jgi:hypothetical protein
VTRPYNKRLPGVCITHLVYKPDICGVFFVGFAFQLEVYSIQLYVIKFVKDLRQGPSFSTGTLVFSTNKTEYEWNRQCDDMFPPPTKLSHDITEIVLKVAFNTITLTTKFAPAKTQVKKHISTAQRKIA